MELKSDIAIAQAAQRGEHDIPLNRFRPMKSIIEIAQSIGIPEEELDIYGRSKAKIGYRFLNSLKEKKEGKLILVTAISPTPAGEGKTTTTVGLGDAFTSLGKKAMVCLREPSLGPVFGMKGGAAGGGFAQVIPMEDINLHFTGDFHAIGLAHNLLSALIDNHLHHQTPLKNGLFLDPQSVTWKRVVDMNDRALREIIIGLGGSSNGIPRESGFDIVVASEVMAIICLATSLEDLKKRLGNIIVGTSKGPVAERKYIRAQDFSAQGSMAVLLKDAFRPNLVQTLQNTPALVHGGPFANIAHGCNSVMATQTALKLSDYVITEAGFGADLGAEKFINIKCQKTGLKPAAAVVVATLRALKFHGGVELKQLETENILAIKQGFANLRRHVENIKNNYGLPCMVALNHFSSDSEKEIETLTTLVREIGVQLIVARHWAEGGKGAVDLAKELILMVDDKASVAPSFLYQSTTPLWEKIERIAMKIYGAKDVGADLKVRAHIQKLQNEGFGHFQICMAKTQYSFATDPKLRGDPSGHTVVIKEVRLAAGAEFLVVICGEIMTMPGLPKVPAAEKIDLDENGEVVGLA